MDESSRYSSPEAAVLKAVDEAGGAKHVGVTLRAEYENAPDTASRWVHHCCGDSNRSKFGLRQLVWIFRAANRAGFHAGFTAFARLCGYVAKPIDIESELRLAREKAAVMLREAQEATRDYDELANRPDLLARARSIHLKVEA